MTSAEQAAIWLRAQGCTHLVAHHQLVSPGSGLLAWPGHRFDPRSQISTALANGALACLIEAQGATVDPALAGQIATLPQLKAQAGLVASAFYGHPSRNIRVIAVTGTNGKTSTAWWLAQALGSTGLPCGLVGTLGVVEPVSPGNTALSEVSGSPLTTPDALALQALWHRWAEAAVPYAAMEASSIGLAEHRLAGTQVHTAIFTNLTRDHLDYHGTMHAYGQAKRLLFVGEGLRAAVINVNDEFGRALALELASSPSRQIDLWTVAVQSHASAALTGASHDGVAAPPARLVAKSVTLQGSTTRFELCEGDQVVPLEVALVGDFNIHNLLGVAAALRAQGLSLNDVAQALGQLQPVPGRLQRVPGPSTAPLAFVDYAHTPDALAKVLSVLRALSAQRGGRLWCVFGCGGDRDRGKRALMGEVAARLAQVVMVTSDNPRSEDPQRIVQDIVDGIPSRGNETADAQVQVEVDRAVAIAQAIARADAADVVLIAGKGHEASQEIQGHKLPFSDAQQAEQALARRPEASA